MNHVKLELTDEELEELEFFVGSVSLSTLEYFCNHLGLKKTRPLQMSFNKLFSELHKSLEDRDK